MAYIDKINKNDTDYDIQDSKAARSVEGDTSSHVEQANQIYTTTGLSQDAEFIFRTTAGTESISTGPALLEKIEGNTVQEGHQEEVKELSYEFADPNTTVSIDWNMFFAEQHVAEMNSGTFTARKTTGSSWQRNLSSGYSSADITISDFGLSVSGNVSEGDKITVEFAKFAVGSLLTATPTGFVSTGFNQYNVTAGYAHVKGGNQYRIDGTYTSLGFAEEIGGTTTEVTVTNNKFTPETDGYIYVTGASGNILIALVWSGVRDSDPYEAYTADTITIPTKDKDDNDLPTASYGMPSVGDVRDELSFDEKLYVQRIGHYAYSAENLEIVEALGVDYWYDDEDIFYVLETPITYELSSSLSGSYEANDFGTEEFTGTSVAPKVRLYYGNNLVDKLRNLADIQAVGNGLTLTNGELSAAESPNIFNDAKNAVVASKSQYASSVGNYSTTVSYTGLAWGPNSVAIGNSADARGSDAIAIGTGGSSGSNMASGSHSISIGFNPRATNTNSIAIGSNARNMNEDSVVIGPSAQSGDNSTADVVIGASATAINGNRNVAIGSNASISSNTSYSMAVGAESGIPYNVRYAIALGAYARPTSNGEMNIGLVSGNTTSGYNGSAYRLLSGVYDGQSLHDAATVAQGNTLSTSAPTTSTIGVLGQLYTDTTNMHTYQCTAIDMTDPNNLSYTWTQRW